MIKSLIGKVITLTLALSTILIVYCKTEKKTSLQPDNLAGKDSYVWSGNLQANYGTSDSLIVGEYQAGTNLQYQTLIEFTGLSEYQGVELQTAVLELYCNNTDTSSAPIYVCRATGSWNEETLRWPYAPRMDTSIVDTGAWPTENTWWSVDVTNIVSAWLSDTATNFGFYIYIDTVTTSTEQDWTSWFSSDYADDETLHPKLTLEYYK